MSNVTLVMVVTFVTLVAVVHDVSDVHDVSNRYLNSIICSTGWCLHGASDLFLFGDFQIDEQGHGVEAHDIVL